MVHKSHSFQLLRRHSQVLERFTDVGFQRRACAAGDSAETRPGADIAPGDDTCGGADGYADGCEDCPRTNVLNRYDVNADGNIDLVKWNFNGQVALWEWDRDGDGNPELIAYDAVETGAGLSTASG